MKVQHYLNLRLIAAVLFAALIAGLAGAYPYLNPDQFNWKGALAAFIVAFAISLAAHVNNINTHNKLDNIALLIGGRPTIRTPATQSPGCNEPPYMRN